MLAGQALTAISKLKLNLLKLPGITIQHKFDVLDKFILPILYNGVKVWGLNVHFYQKYFRGPKQLCLC